MQVFFEGGFEITSSTPMKRTDTPPKLIFMHINEETADEQIFVGFEYENV